MPNIEGKALFAWVATRWTAELSIDSKEGKNLQLC